MNCKSLLIKGISFLHNEFPSVTKHVEKCGCVCVWWAQFVYFSSLGARILFKLLINASSVTGAVDPDFFFIKQVPDPAFFMEVGPWFFFLHKEDLVLSGRSDPIFSGGRIWIIHFSKKINISFSLAVDIFRGIKIDRRIWCKIWIRNSNKLVLDPGPFKNGSLARC